MSHLPPPPASVPPPPRRAVPPTRTPTPTPSPPPPQRRAVPPPPLAPVPPPAPPPPAPTPRAPQPPPPPGPWSRQPAGGAEHVGRAWPEPARPGSAYDAFTPVANAYAPVADGWARIPVGQAMLPPPPPSLVAGAGSRVLSRAIDTAVAWTVFIIVLVAIPTDRAVGLVVLAGCAAVAVEAASLTLWDATPGQLITGMRVAVVGRRKLGPNAALARAATTVSLSLIPVLGQAILATTVLLDPLRQGFYDRNRTQLVVRSSTERPIADSTLAELRPPYEFARCTQHGVVADLNRRRRARAHRLNGSIPLVVGLGVVIIAYAQDSNGLFSRWTDTSIRLFPIALALWFLGLIIDETIEIHRSGQSAGHRVAGLTVLDHITGTYPSMVRSLVRAVCVTLLTTVPPLHLLGAAWVRLAPSNRGLHDLLGGTVVIINGTRPAEPPPADAVVALPPPPTGWLGAPMGAN